MIVIELTQNSFWDWVLKTIQIFLPILSLFATVLFFYWLNLRKGKLHVAIPKSYGALGSKNKEAIIVLPLAIYNDGPKPIIIEDLILYLSQYGLEKHQFSFLYVPEKMERIKNPPTSCPIIVGGRNSILTYCEFQKIPGNFHFCESTYICEIQAKTQLDRNWKTIITFNLNVPKGSFPRINKKYGTYINW